MIKIQVKSRGESITLTISDESTLPEMFIHFRTILIWLGYECDGLGEVDNDTMS